MITDQLLAFLPPASNIAITSVDVASNVIDLLTLGIGVTSANGGVIIGQTRTVFGADTGIGGVKPLVECAVGTSFATSAGATLNTKFQGAVDDGTGNPGTWQTFMETGGDTAAQLAAGKFFGRFDWPPAFPDSFQPRFLRLLFSPSAAFTAGTVAYAVVTMGRPDLANRYMGKNFAVAG